jgi:hypothetical protein
VLVVVGLAAMSVSIVITWAVVAWVPRVGRTAVLPEIPDAAYAGAVLTPNWVTDHRTVPRPLVVALIGLRAAGAVDVAGPADVAGSAHTVSGRPETISPLPRLSLVTTGVPPAGVSELGEAVHRVISRRSGADRRGPGGVSASELTRSAEVAAVLDRIQAWNQEHGLVLPGRRIRMARRVTAATSLLLATAGVAVTTETLRRHGPQGTWDIGWRPDVGAIGVLAAVVAMVAMQGTACVRLARASPTTIAGWAAVERLQQAHLGLRPPDPVWHEVPRTREPAAADGLATCHWMIPQGWNAYRPKEAEWAEALYSMTQLTRPHPQSWPENPPTQPHLLRWACPTPHLDPWTWLSVGLACDPWFCVRAGLYEVEHGIPGVDYLLRRVAVDQPNAPAEAFAVVDIPSHVPTVGIC